MTCIYSRLSVIVIPLSFEKRKVSESRNLNCEDDDGNQMNQIYIRRNIFMFQDRNILPFLLKKYIFLNGNPEF